MDRLTEYFLDRREAMLADLAALCAVPSVHDTPLPGMPFGRAVDEALRLAEGLFAREGFATERDGEGRYALVHFGTGAHIVGIFTHCDVVPAGEGWTLTEAFSPVTRDGVLVARGAHDNKGGVIAALYLLMALRDLGIVPDCRITVFLGGNEESGMKDIAAFVSRGELPEVSLVPDNDPPFSLGEKGRTEAWLVSPPYLSAVREITGGEAMNVVLGTATATLALSEALLSELTAAIDGDPTFALTVEGERGEITLTASGRSAHASAPEGSRNALGALAGLLSSLSCLSADERGILASTAIFARDPYGAVLGIDGEDGVFGRRTAVVGMVRTRGGRIFLSEDIRYGGRFEELLPALAESVDGEEFELCLGSTQDGFDLGDDDPMVVRLLSAYRRVTGDTSSRPYRSGGGTYARCLPRAFSCGVSVGAPVPSEIPKGHGAPHTPDEYMTGEGLALGVRLLAEYLITAAEYLGEAPRENEK